MPKRDEPPFVRCVDCGRHYHPSYRNGFLVGRCPECRTQLASRLVIYDRDRGIGAIPPNLQKAASPP
jgi:hypothetical protein